MNTRRFILSSTHTHTHTYVRAHARTMTQITRVTIHHVCIGVSVRDDTYRREKKEKKEIKKTRRWKKKRKRDRSTQRGTCHGKHIWKLEKFTSQLRTGPRERSFRSLVAHALFAMAHREFNRENALCTQEARKQHAPRISTLEIFSRKTRRECFWRLHSPIIAFIRYKPDENLRARA